MRKPKLGYIHDVIEASDSDAIVQQHVRKLQVKNCDQDKRHCFMPEELDVESPPVMASIPSFSPTLSPTETTILEALTKAPAVFPQSQPPSGSSTDVPTKDPFLYYFDVTTRAPTLVPSNLETRNPSNYPPPYATYSPTFEATMLDINENPSERTEAPTTTPTIFAQTEVGFLVAPTVSPTSPVPTRRPTFLTGSAPTPRPISVPTKLPTPLSTIKPTPRPFVTITATPTSAAPNASGLGVTPNFAPDESSIQPTTKRTAAPTQLSTSMDSQPTNQPITPASHSRPTVPPAAAPAQFSPSKDSQPPNQPITPASQSGPNVPAATPTVKPSSSSTTSCVTDSNGGFGLTVPVFSATSDSLAATNVRFVEYRYQVETTPKFEVTKDDLESGILRNVERSISDVLVASFFPPNEGYLCDPSDDNDSATSQLLRTISNIQQMMKGVGGTNTSMGNNTTSDANAVVGLTADPPDLVRSGTEGGTQAVVVAPNGFDSQFLRHATTNSRAMFDYVVIVDSVLSIPSAGRAC
jgi:hypothetical protein